MPNAAIVYSGFYEVERLRRRRDRRVQEFLFHRSRRVYQPPPPITLCRITKLVLYLIIFYMVLALLTGVLTILVLYFLIPPDEPGMPKIPGLYTVPGRIVDHEKQIVWGLSLRKELSAIRRDIARHVKNYGILAENRILPCNQDFTWGYATGKPCILLVIPQSLGFEAVTYDSAIVLPEDAPNELYDYVLELPVEQRLKRIWVSCSIRMGEGPDVKMNYIPDRYFDADGLFTKLNVFLNVSSENDFGVYTENPAVRRFIALQLTNIPPNTNLGFFCQLWAKNIPLNVGSTKFTLRLMGRVPAPEPKILDEWED